MQVSLKAEASKNFTRMSGKTSNINQERKQNMIKLENRFTILDEDNDECLDDPLSTFKVGKISIFQSSDTKKIRKKKKGNSELDLLFINIQENNEGENVNQLDKSTNASDKQREVQCAILLLKSENCLRNFETYNLFNELIPYCEDEQHKVLKMEEVKKQSKRQLRKCRKCGFKKRNCLLDVEGCKAVNKFCTKCKRSGHFPKSMICKVNKTAKISKFHESNKVVQLKYCQLNPEQYKKDILLLLTRRIEQLQLLDELHNTTNLFNNENAEPTKENYVFSKKNRSKDNCLVKAIHEAANKCAKKFVNNQKPSEEYFIKYCLKKARSIVNEDNPSDKSKMEMKKVLKVYDQMFYHSNGGQDELGTLFDNQCSNKKDAATSNADGYKKETMIPQYDGIIDSDDPCFEENITNYDLHTDTDRDKLVSNLTATLFSNQCSNNGQRGTQTIEDGENKQIRIPQYDGVYDSDDPCFDDNFRNDQDIPQLDGGNDGKENIVKSVFAINCEVPEISSVMNFFRSCYILWGSLPNHILCKFDQKHKDRNCFLCGIRSTCLRLNAKRTFGPKGLKLIEFASILQNYELEGLDWRENKSDIVGFIKNTFKLMRASAPSISSFLGFPSNECKQCKTPLQLKRTYMYQIPSDEILVTSNLIKIKDILDYLVRTNGNGRCCLKSIQLKNKYPSLVNFEFSKLIDIEVLSSESVWGGEFIYVSHLVESVREEPSSIQTYFRHENHMLYQNQSSDICQSEFGIHKNVKVLAIVLTTDNCEKQEDNEKYVYPSQVQKHLQKKYLSIVWPEKHLEKQLKQKEYEKKRNQSPERKKMRQEFDKIRDQEPERREFHKELDKIRNQNPGRREMNNHLDKIRDKYPERKDFHKELDRIRDQAPERREFHKELDKIRDQDPERREFHKKLDKIRNQNP